MSHNIEKNIYTKYFKPGPHVSESQVEIEKKYKNITHKNISHLERIATPEYRVISYDRYFDTPEYCLYSSGEYIRLRSKCSE